MKYLIKTYNGKMLNKRISVKVIYNDEENKNKLKMLVTENGHPKFDRKNEQK